MDGEARAAPSATLRKVLRSALRHVAASAYKSSSHHVAAAAALQDAVSESGDAIDATAAAHILSVLCDAAFAPTVDGKASRAYASVCICGLGHAQALGQA